MRGFKISSLKGCVAKAKPKGKQRAVGQVLVAAAAAVVTVAIPRGAKVVVANWNLLALGNNIGSLPPGFTAPYKISAAALPARLPLCQAYKTASQNGNELPYKKGMVAFLVNTAIVGIMLIIVICK